MALKLSHCDGPLLQHAGSEPAPMCSEYITMNTARFTVDAEKGYFPEETCTFLLNMYASCCGCGGIRALSDGVSEDVGNADPRALGVAVDGLQAYQLVGMPEGRIILGQVCTYLATAPKSNASYLAIDKALELARKAGSLPIPMKLRNAPTKLMKSMGHSEGYRYPHDHGGFVPEHYLPEALIGTTLFAPAGHGYEKQIAERLARWRALREEEG
jgi:hypothetical protein